MQRAGDRLRVNMTLVRLRDGATLWSQTFNTAFADVFEIEDEIATGVVSQLRLSLSPAERMRLTKHHTSNPEAYEYYLKGVATFSSVGAASANVKGNVEAGLTLLERAVAIDPNYALAHAQLAWGAMWLATLGGDAAAYTRARDALRAPTPSTRTWRNRMWSVTCSSGAATAITRSWRRSKPSRRHRRSTRTLATSSSEACTPTWVCSTLPCASLPALSK